jgi:hypothetical protein
MAAAVFSETQCSRSRSALPGRELSLTPGCLLATLLSFSIRGVLMKSLLIMLLISICAIAWRSDDILLALRTAQQPAAPALNPGSIPASAAGLIAASAPAGAKSMTIAEFAKLSKTDPQAYHKLLASHQVEEERGAVDKLMNFLAHGKYE